MNTGWAHKELQQIDIPDAPLPAPKEKRQTASKAQNLTSKLWRYKHKAKTAKAKARDNPKRPQGYKPVSKATSHQNKAL